MDRNLRIRMLLEAKDKVTRPLRDIAGGGRAASQALRGTKDRLRDLERLQGNIASFRTLKTELRGTGTALDAAQARVAALAREMKATEAPGRRLTRQFEQARREASQLTDQQQRQTRELQQVRDRLRDAGVSTSNLVRHERDLRAAIAGTNRELAEQTDRLGRADARARRFAAAREGFSRTQGMATGLAAGGASSIATGLALARPLTGSVGAAREFESVMTDIAQKANLTRAQAAGMGRELLGAARAANQMPEALQQGVETLAGFGLDPRRAAQMMTPIGRAATAYKAEIADLSAAAFAANDNLKVPIEQTGRMIDIMAQAGKDGAFEIRDMAGAFPSLTASYQALGQSGLGAVADLAAAAQIVRKGTGDSASAATNLENILQKINSPATIRAFKKNYGVDLPAAMRRAYQEGKTPLEAIAEITNRTLGGDLSKLGFLFEDAQVQQGLRPLIQNMEEYRRIRAEAAGANGTTDRDFAERLKDGAEQAKQLKIEATTLAINMGTVLLPTVNAIVVRASAFAAGLARLAQRHPMLTKVVLLGAFALTGLLFIFGALAIGAAAILGPIAAINFGLTAMGVAGGVASVGLGPIILAVLGIVAAIALLAAAVYLIVTNWEPISAWFSNLWQGMINTVMGAVAWFGGLTARFSQIGADIIRGMIRGITGMLGTLRNTITGVATSAANWFRQKLGIRSPSRVFAGYGGFLMAGLSQGIAANAADPIGRIGALTRDLQAQIQPLSSDTRIAASGAAARAATGAFGGQPRMRGGDTFNIYAAPGQNPTDIARAVSEELDRRDRRGRADARATFRDDPDGADL